jgi:DNA polymerase III epsilon subunit-like protein
MQDDSKGKYQTLQTACATCGIDLKNAHRAINDAMATRALIFYLGE